MARYFLFIDDSGTKEYASAGEQYGRTGKSRFFVFGGVLLAEDVAAQLAQRIADLKRGAFGRPDVELKSNWLRIPKERSTRYLDRFSISSGTLDSLVEQVYDAVVDTDLQLLAAVVDKAHMQEQYGTHAWYAPAVAYDCLLQRVALEVRPPHAARVFIDDMSGATPKGNQYRDNLRSHHAQLCATGSRLQRDVRFDGIEPGLRFVNSARSHLIQVADIVSYQRQSPVRRFSGRVGGKGPISAANLSVVPAARREVSHRRSWPDSGLRSGEIPLEDPRALGSQRALVSKKAAPDDLALIRGRSRGPGA